MKNIYRIPMRIFCLSAFLFTSVCHSALALGLGKPIDLTNDNEVVEVLPKNYSRLSEQQRESIKFGQLSEAEAAQGIKQYLQFAAFSGDERYLGHANRILEQWQESEIQTIALALAKASLLQRTHQFDQAIQVLDTVIEKSPDNGEAHLQSAYIRMTQGKPKLALRHCSRAGLAYGAMTGITCTATAQSLLGEVDQAYGKMKSLQQSVSLGAIENREALLSLAEMASMKGDFNAAEKYFIEAIELNPNDAFILMRLADLYISQKKYLDCIRLLEGQANPMLTLRWAIAKKQGDGQVSEQQRQDLVNYFDIQQLRNPNLSTRDFGEYLLNIKEDAESALNIAISNWQSQREPADTELVLRSALVSRNYSEIADIVDWIKASGLQDYRINQLIAQLES